MLQPHAAETNTVVISTARRGCSTSARRREVDREDPLDHQHASRRLNDFVIHDDCVYGLDDGVLCCLDLQSGERLWKKGRLGHGQSSCSPLRTYSSSLPTKARSSWSLTPQRLRRARPVPGDRRQDVERSRHRQTEYFSCAMATRWRRSNSLINRRRRLAAARNLGRHRHAFILSDHS